MNMNMSRAVRGLVCLSMVFSVAVAAPTAIPGVAEADAAQARSSVERRLRPGVGYFANSPQSRARSSAPAPSMARPVGPMIQQSGVPVVRAPQVVQPGQVVGRPIVTQPGVVVHPQPGVIHHGGVVLQQPSVLQQPVVQQPGVVQQPMAVPQGQLISAPQR